MDEQPFMRIGSPPAAAPQPRRKRNWLISAVAALVVVCVGSAAAAGGLLLGKIESFRQGPNAGKVNTWPPPAQPYPFAVKGFLTLGQGDFLWYSSMDVCVGEGGYDDIRAGAQVVIRDQNGTTVALGSLGDGLPRRDPDNTSRATECRFPFEVTGIPGGLPFYRIEVSHRGELEYTQDRLMQGVELTLG